MYNKIREECGMNEVLVRAFSSLDDDTVMVELKKMQAVGKDTLEILSDLQAGMQEVGKKFEEN